MKKILLASIAFVGFASAVSAADLPSRTAAPPAPVVAAPPIFTWSGFYAGVNAGYGWNTGDDVIINGVRFSNNDGGFVGGGQLGYNYQIGSFVIGAEGDLQWADLGNNAFSNNNDWFGTVRGRAGVAFDRALVYGTGGFAFADGGNGWTAGGGVEYAFTNNLSAKVEGLYVNVDRGGVLNTKDEFGVVRAGLNFRFGSY